MRRIQAIAIIGIMLVTGPVRAGEKEAKELLARAIKAHGGTKALTRAAQLKRKDSGTQSILTRQVPFTIHLTRSLPDRLHQTIESGGIKSTVVVNGDRAWQSDGGPAVVLLPARVKELREEMYVDWVATLVPLRDSEFTLSSLPKKKLAGEVVAGIKASHKDRPDIRLYFGERNGLLVKIEREARVAGLKVDQEYLYSDHKDFDGVKLPTRQTVLVNGKKFTEFTSSDVTFPAKVDARMFAKP